MYAKRTGQSARLIIREGSGYRRNPELKITTDMEQFDKHMKAAELTSNSLERIDELRKAVDLYKTFPLVRWKNNVRWITSQYSSCLKSIRVIPLLHRRIRLLICSFSHVARTESIRW